MKQKEAGELRVLAEKDGDLASQSRMAACMGWIDHDLCAPVLGQPRDSIGVHGIALPRTKLIGMGCWRSIQNCATRPDTKAAFLRDDAHGVGVSLVYSPRVWGWTDMTSLLSCVPNVFPTRVGVDRPYSRMAKWSVCIPHACGGGPWRQADAEFADAYSPRVWGWTAYYDGL